MPERRVVRFFRAVDDQGRPVEEDLDWDGLLGVVQGFSDTQARVESDSGAELLGLPWFAPEGQGTPSLLVVCNIRRGTGLPALELGRQFRKVDLAEGEGIAEASHVGFFPGNIFAIMRSGYSPSQVRVAEYLNRAIAIDPPLSLEPVYRKEVRRKLAEVDNIRLFHLKVESDQVGRLQARVPRLGRLFRQLTEEYGSVTASVDLRLGDVGFDEESKKLLEDVKTLVRDDDEGGPIFQEAKLSYRSTETERGEMIDFVNERIATQVVIEGVGNDPDSAIPTRSAAEAIARAYDMARLDLREALD